ncbi:MAG: thrombospondin type 3 repeat-containing protein [Candidatus Magasanikbacteria bacterium]
MKENNQEKKLSGSQKTGFVLLFVFALLTVGLSFLQIRNNIYNPFATKISQAEVDAMQALKYDENTRLQQIDTDHDGLNDYEEINFYTTSRYLPDTDSDGLTDKQEVDNGTDPLCREGQTCIQDEFATASSSDTNISPLLSEVQTPDQILLSTPVSNSQNISSGTTTANTGDINSLLNDPNSLREMLASTGKVTLDDLKSIDDATLLEMAKKLFSSQFQASTTTTP